MFLKQGFWAAFGKFSAVVTVVGTVIGLYLALAPSGPRIRAVYSYYPYAVPPDLESAMSAIRKAESLEEIKRVLEKGLPQDRNPDLPSAFELSRLVTDHLEGAWPKEFRYGSPNYSALHYLTITNDGDRPGEDVTLDLPESGVALITADDKTQHSVPLQRTLKLGVLRPRTLVSIAIWSPGYRASWGPGELNLTHSLGLGTVVVGKQLFGLRATVADNLGFILWLIGSVLMWAFVMVLSIQGNWVIATVKQSAGASGSKKEEAAEPNDRMNPPAGGPSPG